MRSLRKTAVIFLLCLATVGHGYTVPTNDGPVIVDNFGYQLQGSAATGSELLPAPLAAAPHDLLVIDFARFGDEGSKFTPAEVAQMQDSPIGLGGDGQRKSVVAYVSIGEASEFRTYWDTAWTDSGIANSPLTASAPSWLGPVNPDWDESRKVRYWQAGWQEVMYNAGGNGWIDQVVTQGFDGAYLDIVDAYHYWGSEVGAADQQPGDPADEQDAARRMVDFVVAMTAHARQTNPSFFVIPQNGEFILSDLQFGPNPEAGDAQRRADYLNAIAAIGIEDTYFRGDLEENNLLDPDAVKIAILKADFLAAGRG